MFGLENIIQGFSLKNFAWIKDLLDIALVSYIVYRVLLLIKGTRAVQLLKGLLVLFLVYYIVNNFLQFKLMAWIMQNAATVIIIAIPIVFQPELRRLLAYLGQERILVDPSFIKGKEFFDFIKSIVYSVKNMSQSKTGALIVIERTTGLNEFIETGVKVDSIFSPELLESIFYSGTPLHDGAVILTKNRISAAAVLLPLSENLKLRSGKQNLGTRHRAALGLSETSDSICIIVSEETGDISVALGGKLHRHLKEDTLENLLLENYQNVITKEITNFLKFDIFSKFFSKFFGKKKKENIDSKEEKTDLKETESTESITTSENKETEKNNKIKKYLTKKNTSLKITAIATAIVLTLLVSEEIYSVKNERIFVLPVNIENSQMLNSQNKIAKLRPSHVKLRLTGDKMTLENLKVEDLNLFVNLEKMDFKQSLDVKVHIPSGIRVKELNPQTITVTLYEK